MNLYLQNVRLKGPVGHILDMLGSIMLSIISMESPFQAYIEWFEHSKSTDHNRIACAVAGSENLHAIACEYLPLPHLLLLTQGVLKSAQKCIAICWFEYIWYKGCMDRANPAGCGVFCSQVGLSGGSVNQASMTCEHTVGIHEACCWHLNAIINYVS